jgi:hypothetical protein
MPRILESQTLDNYDGLINDWCSSLTCTVSQEGIDNSCSFDGNYCKAVSKCLSIGENMNFITVKVKNSVGNDFTIEIKNKSVDIHGDSSVCSITNLKHSQSSSRSLFLDTQKSSLNFPITTVTLRNANFSACNYGVPLKNDDELQGGLIGVVGKEDKRITLIVENVIFENIKSVESLINCYGVVNGGAIYGKYLNSVLVNFSSFDTCYAVVYSSDKVGVIGGGSGGALYIEEVKTLLSAGFLFLFFFFFLMSILFTSISIYSFFSHRWRSENSKNKIHQLFCFVLWWFNIFWEQC